MFDDGDSEQFTLAEFNGPPGDVAEPEPAARIPKEPMEEIAEALADLEDLADVTDSPAAEAWDRAAAEAKLVLIRARISEVRVAVAERRLEQKDRRPPAPEHWYH